MESSLHTVKLSLSEGITVKTASSSGIQSSAKVRRSQKDAVMIHTLSQHRLGMWERELVSCSRQQKNATRKSTRCLEVKSGHIYNRCELCSWQNSGQDGDKNPHWMGATCSGWPGSVAINISHSGFERLRKSPDPPASHMLILMYIHHKQLFHKMGFEIIGHISLTFIR